MDGGLKQRVVGAVVLIGAAVILLPNLLNGPVVEPRLAPVQMPDKPAMPEFDPIFYDDRRAIEINDRISADRLALAPEPSGEDVASSEDEKGKATSGAKDQSLTDDQNDAQERHLSAAWTIQLASFKESVNAQELVKQLQQQGYNAYFEKIKISQGKEDGEVIRVFVGPELKKGRAENIKEQLQQQLNLEGMVIRFVP